MICSRSADEDHADLLSYIIRESFREQAVILKMNPACYPNYSAFETGEKVRARLSSGDHALLFYANDEAVGTISYQIAPADSKVGYIKRFAILPAYRKRGYSELLMKEAEQSLQELGVARIEISIVAQFEKLQKYYERMGYKVLDRKTVAALPFEVTFMSKAIYNTGDDSTDLQHL